MGQSNLNPQNPLYSQVNIELTLALKSNCNQPYKMLNSTTEISNSN